MNRRARGALAMLVAACAACEPKPGARIEVHGTLSDIPDDPGLPTVVVHQHAVADGKFFWVSGGWLVSRPLTGGERTQLASVADDAEVVVTRDDVVTIVSSAPAPDTGKRTRKLVAVPRAGGPVRTIPLPESVRDVSELRALSDAVLWLDSTLLYTNRADQPPVKTTSRILMLRPRDEHPEPVPVIVGDLYNEIARLETDGRSGFVAAVAVDGGYRIDVYDGVAATPRAVHVLPYAQYHSSYARDEMDLVLGSEHVFMVAPHHSLMSSTSTLVAVPRQGGAAVTVDGAICPGTLTAAGDVPYFVTPAKGTHCAGEFPAPQKLQIRRGSLANQPFLLYEAYDTSIWFEQIAANQMILREGVPIPRDVPPISSRYRSALFTFDP